MVVESHPKLGFQIHTVTVRSTNTGHVIARFDQASATVRLSFSVCSQEMSAEQDLMLIRRMLDVEFGIYLRMLDT